MKLLTKEIRRRLPPLYATENTRLEEKIAQVKFFAPDSGWTWYAVEFDGKDLFFGYVIGLEKEWGYFSLAELQSVRGHLGRAVERDLYFKPTPVKELMRE